MLEITQTVSSCSKKCKAESKIIGLCQNQLFHEKNHESKYFKQKFLGVDNENNLYIKTDQKGFTE